MSPMLANIYMHHVLTLWFKLVVQRKIPVEYFREKWYGGAKEVSA